VGSFDKSGQNHVFNVRRLREARHVLKPDGILWVSGTHHVIFSLDASSRTWIFKRLRDYATSSEIHRRFIAGFYHLVLWDRGVRRKDLTVRADFFSQTR
jgi:hypothetical protein